MRKAQKQEIFDFIDSLHQAHEEIRGALERKDLIVAQNMIGEAQEFAVSLGENIEKLEGKGHVTVFNIEEYCDTLFYVFEDISKNDFNENKVYKTLRKQLIKVENSVKNDIHVRKEIVFFPYKASMWDSLESVYLAAKEDPDCDAYCVAIPYFDLNPDHSFGQMHYEGKDYPKEIEVIDYKTYSFEERKPDVIYIHYPYDEWNLVTSIDPRFYSSNLKKYTECLVYIPYYTTSGGMSKGQELCPAYINADYIVIQSPEFRAYFDERISDKKFLPFGSPKFDRIIKKCQNPLKPPKDWEDKMKGKKVYFYNTSIGGMLGDTEAFINKLIYVFRIFKDRKDSCILWRPHPLLESTFDSMRSQYRQAYEGVKRYFVENDIGILDRTPDMGDAIAWSDAYIGDSGTSVTSVFGIVGKPVFILNNRIHSRPKKDSWRGEIVGNIFNFFEQDRFAITQGNKLYISEPYKYDYKYFCNLSKYSNGDYYLAVFEIKDKKYVCPRNAQNILVLNDKGIERKIELEKHGSNKEGSFFQALPYGKYLILLPFKYPALVIYNTETDRIRYLENGIDVFVADNERNEKVTGGWWITEGMLYMTSPVDNRIYALDIENGKSDVIELQTRNKGGYISMVEKNHNIWMLPYRGQTVLKWNPKTGEIREYTGFPKEFVSIHPRFRIPTDENPLGSCAFDGKIIYFTRNWGSMDLKLDTETGVFSEWEVPVPDKENMETVSREYFYTTGKYGLIWSIEDEDTYKLFYYPERKLFDFDIEKNQLKEIRINFDKDELRQHEDGFNDSSQWLKYCCCENAFNSLENFLDGNIVGNRHDKKKQMNAYSEIAANNDGSCGEKVHEFIKDHT